MMIPGTLTKVRGGWVAACHALGAYSEGKTRAEAAEMLANAVLCVVDRDDLEVTVTETGKIDGTTVGVSIDSKTPGVLVAYMLLVQRELAGLSLAEVARRVGDVNASACAAYEQGKREPSISTLQKIMAVVAPKLGFIVGPRELVLPMAKARAISR